MRNGLVFLWSVLLSVSLCGQHTHVDVRAGVFRSLNADDTGLNLGVDLFLGEGIPRYFLSYDRLEEFVIFSEPAQINLFTAGMALEKDNERRRFSFLFGVAYVHGYEGDEPGSIDRPEIQSLGAVLRMSYQWWLGEHLALGLNGSFYAASRIRYLAPNLVVGYRLLSE